MVNCPWFLEAANYFRQNPELDIGVHLTLTAEWLNYKWGPLLRDDSVPSLISRKGHFFGHDFYRKALPEHAYLECKAQILKALKYGLNISHLDCHMNCLSLTPELFDVYVQLGKEFGLPIMSNQPYAAYFGYDIDDFMSHDEVLVSEIFIGQWNHGLAGLEAFYRNSFLSMKSGLNVLLVHPAFNDPEMQAICLDSEPFGAQWRQFDYDYFLGSECRQRIEGNNIQLVTWRDVKNRLFG
jgi:predicted glycoside hydrolase/deacetylase ChbG (UPF0249 family)